MTTVHLTNAYHPTSGGIRTFYHALLDAADREHRRVVLIVPGAKTFVHPNPREPFGIGPLEAMASGVPVVVPDSGGVLEYATPANAWVTPPDAASFAASVRAACGADRARVSAALETAHRFRWNRATARYFALYDEIVWNRAVGSRAAAMSVTYS